MLPTNVMSFMKKMVATEGTTSPNSETSADSGTAFGKLRQTLSSSLLTAQDRVTKMTPRPSLIPDIGEQVSDVMTSSTTPPVSTPTGTQHGTGTGTTTTTNTTSSSTNKSEPGKPPSRAGACRVCLKAFKPDDFSRTCSECTQRVCEDCASYSKLDANEDQSSWKCSVCRRRLQSRAVVLPQDSTDSLLDVPILDTLQRRHSDVKLGGSRTDMSGSGLAPPRSPELRRHSDVSPAALKELEKKNLYNKQLKGGNISKAGSGDLDWGRSRSGGKSPPRRGSEACFESAGSSLPITQRTRRMSRVMPRQHSYDDEIKNAAESGTKTPTTTECGLGLPAPIARRASAYDVYAPGVLAAAQASALGGAQEGPGRSLHVRRGSFRALPDDMPTEPPAVEAPTLGGVAPGGGLAVEDDRRTRRRGSQLPDIATLRALPSTPWSAAALEDLEAPRRQQSVDGEAIKIVIHDVDSGPVTASKRRVVLRRDPADKAHRTRGFGMRVVGGKTDINGHLFAYIVWTVPGGPAEKGGLQQGDKVLEWGGVPLTDRSFEEVCAIMDHATGDTIELLVEHATDFRMCDLLEEMPNAGGPGGIGGAPTPQRKTSDAGMMGLQIDTDADTKQPSSPTRRKLPKTPEQIAREKQVSGRVQIQVWYNDERRELVVSILAGDDLAPRDDSLGFGNLPEAYAKLRLLPITGDHYAVQTEVAPASQNPIWNANLTFPNVTGEDLMGGRLIELTLWDLVPHSEPVFLGECTADLQKAFLDDRAVWYRLEDPKQLRGVSISKSPYTSPRGSIGGIDVGRLIRRGDFTSNRSVSDDLDSIGDSTSLLHPDHAWTLGGGSRRGSSQSEQLEVEVYQLGRDFSRSLPGSRRSSFQSAQQDSKDSKDNDLPPEVVTYHRQRRRSSCTKMLRDPDEILRSLKQVKGELGRTMSLTNEKRSSRRSSAVSTGSRKDSVLELPELPHIDKSPSEDDEDKWCLGDDSSDSDFKLGPGQIQPRGYRMAAGKHGDVKLGLLMTKGHLEVEIIGARNICSKETDNPPDTYVKCYLRDGERWMQKRKTRVVRHSVEPLYRQTLRYQACDCIGRTLLVMLWERQGGFEHNHGLGGAEVALDNLSLTHPVTGWYPLFPIHSLGSDSNDSP